MSASATIEADEFLPHPVSLVWDALTDSERMAVWLMPNDFVPRVGHRCTLDTGNWGTTECEVLEVEPQQLLRYSWRNGPLDTEVVWRLVPEGHGTRLLLEHRGFDLDHPIQRTAYRRDARRLALRDAHRTQTAPHGNLRIPVSHEMLTCVGWQDIDDARQDVDSRASGSVRVP